MPIFSLVADVECALSVSARVDAKNYPLAEALFREAMESDPDLLARILIDHMKEEIGDRFRVVEITPDISEEEIEDLRRSGISTEYDITINNPVPNN